MVGVSKATLVGLKMTIIRHSDIADRYRPAALRSDRRAVENRTDAEATK
jgi:hypothetical protein